MTEMTNADRGQVAASAAEVYQEFFVPALFGQFAPSILDAAGVGPGHRVLDVGCGTGVLAGAAAARVGAGGAVTGLDPNDGMLTVARKSAAAVTWQAGVAESLPFEDGSLDRVLSQFALMFFEDRAAAMREAARVLAPGGRAAFATWAPIDESPGYAAMVELLRRLFGEPAAQALLAPFALGDEQVLADLAEPVLGDVEVTRHGGFARFDSIDAWVHTEIRGWTLADQIDDDDFTRLLAEARRELAPFSDSEGRVSFPAPALIVVGSHLPA
jgi:SAM-dependent methyltransferase